ncbi:hypothetical protein ACFX16_004297 [Malus domestica]
MMIFYRSNDALMCKIFTTTLQGETQDWFHTLPPQSIRSFDGLSLFFTKEYSSYRSCKAEKAKIVRCDDSITSAAFQKGLLTDLSLFGEIIMKENITLADSFALADKHALWDEVQRPEKTPEQPRKESVVAQRKKDGKPSNKSKQKAKHKNQPTNKESLTTKKYSKFSIPIHQILNDINNEPLFKLSK